MNIIAGILGLFVGLSGFAISFFFMGIGGGLGKIGGGGGLGQVLRDGGDAILAFGWFFLICSLLFTLLSASCFTAKNRIISAIVLVLSIPSILFGAGITFFG